MKPRMLLKRTRQKGFTMMELIMVIVILGVLGVVGADFISSMFVGFSQTNSRLELYEEGKSALVRMERELHGMLPNAICVMDGGGGCLSSGAPGNEIRFAMIGEYSMPSDLVGKYQESSTDLIAQPDIITDINAPVAPPLGSIVSIYNTNWTDFVAGGRLFGINSIDGSGAMTLSGNITSPSPHQRYYVIDRAISYRWDPGTGVLSRAVETVTESGAGNFSTVTEYPLARDVVGFDFYYAEPSLARNGIISIVFTLSKDDTQVNMHKEIHVKNVP